MKVYWLCFKCFILIQMIRFKKTTKQLFLNFCKTLLMVLTLVPHHDQKALREPSTEKDSQQFPLIHIPTILYVAGKS